MQKQVLAVLNREYINNWELLINKVHCARQALRPNAVTSYAPNSAKDKFFREAIFAYADALYLEEYFWRDLAKQYGISVQDISKLYIDFNTRELLVEEG